MTLTFAKWLFASYKRPMRLSKRLTFELPNSIDSCTKENYEP
jgi:hypothetical protein